MSDVTMKLTQPPTISSDDGAPLISGTVKHTPDGDMVGIWLDETGYDVPIEVWRAFVVALDPEHAHGAMGVLRTLSDEHFHGVGVMAEIIRARMAGRSGYQAKLAINALAKLAGMDPERDESSVAAMAEHVRVKLDSARSACDDAMMHLHELALGELRVGATYNASKIADVIRAKHVRELQATLDMTHTELARVQADAETFKRQATGWQGKHDAIVKKRDQWERSSNANGATADGRLVELESAARERASLAEQLASTDRLLSAERREHAVAQEENDELERRLDVIAVVANGDDRDPRVSE